MMKTSWLVLLSVLLGIASVSCFLAVEAADDGQPYLLGVGKADVTGPARGVQMWGFVRDGQVTEGIHFRLFSRAFVIAERETPANRVAFVSIDIGSVTNAMQREVVNRLAAQFGDAYTLDNVILSATHTHSGPGGFWHYGVDSPLGGAFLGEHFNAIVDGVVASIAQAHNDLQPGSLRFDVGDVEGAGANRSMAAYNANPESERTHYGSEVDKTMTLLKLERGGKPLGMVNWFASHPTAMTYNNRLISGDHKGFASAQFETDFDPDFVGAFAQSAAGDISPNLNLDNTGPGENEFETTRIIGERQLDVARKLFGAASRPLTGPIRSRQYYIDFTYRPVDAAYTNGAGAQTTCPSAFGYAFAAGSTEDGGGNPLFKEGMKTRNSMVDGLVKSQFQLPEPSDRCRECQGEKAILFATGETNPPSQTQVSPITLTRVGQLTIASIPAEATTMAGRRLRNTVAEAMGGASDHVVIAGYSNDYGGYITTKEEYDTQQYEGGHTLFGPWTLAAYRQEFDRLAKAMRAGDAPDTGAEPRDLRGVTASTPVLSAEVVTKAPDRAGHVEEEPKKRYRGGDLVEVTFWSEDPRVGFPHKDSFFVVERKDGESWTVVATDNDWSTKCRWLEDEKNPGSLAFHVSWQTDDSVAEGDYRIRHASVTHGGEPFTGTTRTFAVR